MTPNRQNLAVLPAGCGIALTSVLQARGRNLQRVCTTVVETMQPSIFAKL